MTCLTSGGWKKPIAEVLGLWVPWHVRQVTTIIAAYGISLCHTQALSPGLELESSEEIQHQLKLKSYSQVQLKQLRRLSISLGAF